MKKELTVHFVFLVSFSIFLSLARGWLDLSHWMFWIGGIVGTVLPDLDHLVYIFFIKPHELTSQRTVSLLGKKEVLKALNLLAETRSERRQLIFHTVGFQIIFFILTFLVVTSSGSYFGTGLVLAFSLHLLVDQLVDFFETDSLDNWFKQIPFKLEREKIVFYWLAVLFVFLFLAFLL